MRALLTLARLAVPPDDQAPQRTPKLEMWSMKLPNSQAGLQGHAADGLWNSHEKSTQGFG